MLRVKHRIQELRATLKACSQGKDFPTGLGLVRSDTGCVATGAFLSGVSTRHERDNYPTIVDPNEIVSATCLPAGGTIVISPVTVSASVRETARPHPHEVEREIPFDF